jgi:predicted nucleic acid-binding protein
MVRKRIVLSERAELELCTVTTQPSSQPSQPGAVIVDANVAVAISSKEAGRESLATTVLYKYAGQGYEWFAPGAIVTETLYALCQKRQAGLISATEHDDAVNSFEVLMGIIQSPPGGDAALVRRAYEICNNYGCSRSADAVYIALAEEMDKTRPTVLLTFDQGVPKQASKNALTVVVEVLTI